MRFCWYILHPLAIYMETKVAQSSTPTHIDRLRLDAYMLWLQLSKRIGFFKIMREGYMSRNNNLIRPIFMTKQSVAIY